MTNSKRRILGAAAVSCAFAMGGVLTFAQPAGPGRGQEPARAVAELAEVLKRHPPRRQPAEDDRLRLYMMDLVAGGTTLIADEPEPGLNCCGTPKWSHDGRRIIFDATPGTQFQVSRIKAIEVRDGVPTITDLGRGNCPTFSPDDKRIAFMLNPGAEPGAQAGVWVMQADGSERRLVGQYGAPFWSPDGREFLVNSFSTPTEAIVINLKDVRAGAVEVPGHGIFSWPSWAGPGRLVACLGTQNEGDTIALLDVRNPGEAKIIEVLWKRGEDLDVTPLWPVYWPEAGRCVFVGREPKKRTLYTVRRGQSTRATRLEPRGYNDRLGGLSFSPDGRYLLFCANRPDPPDR
jgi:dipeptidyl aminopeptidase/acylaminoacyl peptidase